MSVSLVNCNNYHERKKEAKKPSLRNLFIQHKLDDDDNARDCCADSGKLSYQQHSSSPTILEIRFKLCFLKRRTRGNIRPAGPHLGPQCPTRETQIKV